VPALGIGLWQVPAAATAGVVTDALDLGYRLIDGAVLDYDTNLVSKGFFFQNPHAKSTCGCGTSFSV
jgi:iron-sulfur cluster assembly accessory protein